MLYKIFDQKLRFVHCFNLNSAKDKRCNLKFLVQSYFPSSNKHLWTMFLWFIYSTISHISSTTKANRLSNFICSSIFAKLFDQTKIFPLYYVRINPADHERRRDNWNYYNNILSFRLFFSRGVRKRFFFCSLLHPSDAHDDNQWNIYTMMKHLGRSSQAPPVACSSFVFGLLSGFALCRGQVCSNPR